MIKKILLILLIILFSSSVLGFRSAMTSSGGIDLYSVERDNIGFLDGDNNWTGVNYFTNISIDVGSLNFTESDPIYSAWDKSTGINISYLQIYNLLQFTDANYLRLDTTNDPVNDLIVNNTLNITGTVYSGEIKWDGTNLNGTINYTDGILRFNPQSSLVVYDTGNEAHLVDADLERFDEVRANTFTTPLNVSTFSNITGVYVNVSTADGNRIAVIVSNGTSSLSERFPYSTKILELTSGTNSTPVLNRVYIKIVGGVFTWFATTSEPTGQHAMVARIMVGSNGYVYSAALQEDGSSGVLKRIQRTNRKRGLLYENGMNYTASATNLIIDSGNYINGIYDKSTKLVSIANDGFYLILNNGSYVSYSSLSDINQYADSNIIGNNKYYNVIFGIIPYDSNGRIYAIVQNKPSTEYTSTTLAYADTGNTLNVYPSGDFERIMFLPISRMIINSQSNEAQLLPNNAYAEDYRGGVAGGVASGGGLTEADPIYSAWDKSTGITIYESQIIDLNHTIDTTLNDTDILALGYNHTIDIQSWVAGQSYLTVESDPLFILWGYDYNSLIHVPTDLDNFSNSPGYITTDTNCSGNICDVTNTGTLDGYEAIALLDNTDNQTLSYNSGTDEISITGGNTIDISEVNTDTKYSATGKLLDLTGTTFSINEGILTDERICEFESTGSQLECTKTLDSTDECTGDICGGGHTHPASQITSGTFDSGNYIFKDNLTIQKDLNVINAFYFDDQSEGDWRIIQDSDNLSFQKNIGGTWTTKFSLN